MHSNTDPPDLNHGTAKSRTSQIADLWMKNVLIVSLDCYFALIFVDDGNGVDAILCMDFNNMAIWNVNQRRMAGFFLKTFQIAILLNTINKIASTPLSSSTKIKAK